MYPALAIALLVAAQQPQPGPAPTFRSGIDVLRLEANVVDGQGSPVADLTAADFSVTVDGRDRKVLFARFTGASPTTGTPESPAGGAGSYATNVGAPAGRALVFVIDLDSIRSGNEKAILDTAARLVDALPPADAVALVPIPGASLDLTRDHASVSRALRTLHGTTALPRMHHMFTLAEAIAFEKGDSRVIAEVVERECQNKYESDTCPRELSRETRDYLLNHRSHTQNVLRVASSVAQRLSLITASRSIVLISAALAFEPETLLWFRDAETALKRAEINVYALHVEQPDFDASDTSFVRRDRDREHQAGVASVATMAGGEFFAGVGTASGVFERVQARIASSYEIAVEAFPRDDDRKPHAVTISVRTNPSFTVRWRRGLILSRPAVDATRRLAELMAQPLIVPDLPIAASVHTVRGEEAATVKAVVAATFGEGVVFRTPVQYALTFRANDRSVFETNGNATIGSTRGRAVFAAQLAPGAYTMLLAAVDAEGRGGSLEMPVRVGLRIAGDLQMSDVILHSAGETATPSLGIGAGAPLTASLELYALDPGRFPSVGVRFEVRRGTAPAVLAAAQATLAPTDFERKQIAQGDLATATLASGEYTVSAIVSDEGQQVAKVSRPLFITHAAPTVASPEVDAALNVELPSAALATDPALDEVLRKVSRYVAAYGAKASLVVGVEKYTQEVTLPNGEFISGPPRVRQLVAEFALVKTGGAEGWTGFRDVVEVNGDSVHDRRDRLIKLLTQPSGSADDVWRMADESARYNIGPIARNFNVPTTALFFFHPANVSRFAFARKGTRKIDNVNTWEIAFRETKRPTLIGTRAGKDVPAEGTLWVVPDDGTVVRTRLRLRGFADAMALGEARGPSSRVVQSSPQSFSTPAGPTQSPGSASSGGASSGGASSGGASSGGASSGGASSGGASGQPPPVTSVNTMPSGDLPAPAQSTPDLDMTELTPIASRIDVEVTYRPDATAAMWLPSRMSEEYEGAIPRVRAEPLLGSVRTIATYSEFKKFETSAKIVTPK